jgi:hypothetical protein
MLHANELHLPGLETERVGFEESCGPVLVVRLPLVIVHVRPSPFVFCTVLGVGPSVLRHAPFRVPLAWFNLPPRVA